MVRAKSPRRPPAPRGASVTQALAPQRPHLVNAGPELFGLGLPIREFGSGVTGVRRGAVPGLLPLTPRPLQFHLAYDDI